MGISSVKPVVTSNQLKLTPDIVITGKLKDGSPTPSTLTPVSPIPFPIEKVTKIIPEFFGTLHKPTDTKDFTELSNILNNYTHDSISDVINIYEEINSDQCLNLFTKYSAHLNLMTYGIAKFKGILILITELFKSEGYPNPVESVSGGIHMIPWDPREKFTYYLDDKIELSIFGDEGILRSRPRSEDYDIYNIKLAYFIYEQQT